MVCLSGGRQQSTATTAARFQGFRVTVYSARPVQVRASLFAFELVRVFFSRKRQPFTADGMRSPEIVGATRARLSSSRMYWIWWSLRRCLVAATPAFLRGNKWQMREAVHAPTANAAALLCTRMHVSP